MALDTQKTKWDGSDGAPGFKPSSSAAKGNDTNPGSAKNGGPTTYPTRMVFGDESGPGFLGTGQYGVDKIDIDQNAYYNNQALEGDRDVAQRVFTDVQNRQAPTSQAAQLGQASLANAAYGQAALGTAQNAQNTVLGNANLANAAQISRDDMQFRNQQAGLAGRLELASQGLGPSVAASQLGQANAAATAQRMASAASDRGFGNTSATNRQLAYQQGAAQQNNAINSAQMRIQEQQAAQQALGSVLGNARGQDIGLSTSQAGFNQQTALANQGAQNQFALTQAELNQQTALQNAAAGNQFGLANQNALNQQSQLNQNSQNQFSLANQQVQNQFALQQGGFNQQTALANQTAQLQGMGLNDAQIRAMLGTSVGIDQQIMANQQAYNELAVTQNNALQSTQAQAYDNAAKNRQSLIGMVASDEDEKKNINEMDSNSVDEFLDSIKFGAKPDESSYDELALSSVDQKTGVQPASSSSVTDFLNTFKGEDPLDSILNKFKSDQSVQAAARKTAASSSGSTMQASAPAESSGMGGMGMMAMLSDKKEKTNTGSSKADVKDFIDNIGSHKYKYKDPNMLGADDKEHYGPMAQELEKSKIGKSMVKEVNGTKMVDFPRGFGAMLSAMADLNTRLKRVEKK